MWKPSGVSLYSDTVIQVLKIVLSTQVYVTKNVLNGVCVYRENAKVNVLL